MRWYNSQIYSKLGVNNREDALAAAEALSLLAAISDGTTSPAAAHNLPAQITAFVGRQSELADLARLLDQPDIRLITVLAPGGMGKTRLGLAAAERQLRHFNDGVFFVPLAPLNSPANIETSIADALGLNLSSGDPPLQQLLEYLRPRHTLLLLDNFEHLLEGAPLITAILQAAPQVKVLATSREKLNLNGETIFTLSGLQFPDWETPEDALEYDAVQLFMQSAQRVRPDFELIPDELDYLARICRLSAGMPLALVLAATWVDMLAIDQLAHELQQGIDILETELRDVPDRQRSVRATFNYSWGRLSEAEQQAFMKLSVFRGGFTAEAAQAVAGASLRQLRKLVDKALLQTLPTGRYDIHDLLRQYAEEKLRAAGDLATVEEAHTQYFADFMQQRTPDIKGRRQLAGLNEIEADFQNVRTAWQRATVLANLPAINAMMEGLWLFGKMRGRQRESEDLLEAALKAVVPDNDDSVHPTLNRLRLWWISVAKESREHDPNVIMKQLEACKAIAQEQGDDTALAHCMLLQAWYKTAGPKVDWENAVKQYQEAAAQFRAVGENYHAGRTLEMIGFRCLRGGAAPDDPVLVDTIEEHLNLTRTSGDRIGMGTGHYLAAINADAAGRYAESAARFREALEIWTEMGYMHGLTNSLIPQAFMALFQGQFEVALNYAEQMIAVGPRVNSPGLVHNARTIQGFITTIAGNYDAGLRYVNQAEGAPLFYRGIHFNHTIWRTRTLATFCLGDRDQAARHAETGLKGLIENYNARDAAQWLPVAALLLAEEDHKEYAAKLIGLLSSHPDSIMGWLERWPLWPQLCQDLEAALGPEAYAAALQWGQALDLHSVAADLLAAFSNAERQ